MENSLEQTNHLENFVHDIKTALVQNLYSLQHLNETSTSVRSCIDNTKVCLELLDAAALCYLEKTPSPQSFNLKSVVAQLTELFQAQAQIQNNQLMLNIDLELAQNYIGLMGPIQLILLNLVSNALRHTQQGSVTVSLSRQKLDDALDQIHLSVQDTGHGMEEHIYQDIFTKGFSTNAQHSGLGLNICQGLVALLHGDIKVTSHPHQGSQFSVTFPLKHSQSISSELTIENAQSSLKILVIDDDRVSSKYLKHHFSQHHCDIVHHMSDAMMCLSQQTYDVILIDFHLREFEFADCIQWIQAHTSSQLIVISAYLTEQEKQLIYGLNISHTLLKPIAKQELLKIIQPSSSSHLVIDWDKTLEHCQMKPDLLIEMCQLFLQETARDIQLIEQALIHDDFKTVGDLTHKIRGAICYIKAPQLSKILDQIDHALNHETTLLPTHMSALRQAFHLIEKKIQQRLSKFKPATSQEDHPQTEACLD